MSNPVSPNGLPEWGLAIGALIIGVERAFAFFAQERLKRNGGAIVDVLYRIEKAQTEMLGLLKGGVPIVPKEPIE